jgi:mannose-1-phosphate guanylyltransferase
MVGGIEAEFQSRITRLSQQFWISNTGRTLIQAKLDRFAQFISADHIYIVTLGQYKDIVQEQIARAR